LGDMGDIADDINEVFSLQSSVYKAIGEPHRSSASNPAGSRAPDTPQRPCPRVVTCISIRENSPTSRVLTLPFLPLALAEMMADRTDPDRTPPDVMIPADEIRNCQGLAFMWTYKVGMFLSFSAGNGMVIRKRKGSGGDIEWSLPCAISFGGAGGGLDFGAACSSTVVVLNTKEAVEYFSGQHVKLAFDAQACAGPVGRAVEGAVAIAQADPTTGSNFDAEQYTTYGTSEGLFAGAGAHATWISVRDAQNEDYYRREMSGRDILNCFGEPAGEHGRRHDEIFRLHSTLNAAASGGKPVKLIAAREKFTRGSTAEARGTPF